MKEQMLLVFIKIKNLEIRVENSEKNQNGFEKILDYVIRMNEDGLKELARFVLELRKNDMPFGL